MFASRAWTEDAAQSYWSDPGFIRDAKERTRITKLRMAAKQTHDLLFPEGDD